MTTVTTLAVGARQRDREGVLDEATLALLAADGSLGLAPAEVADRVREVSSADAGVGQVLAAHHAAVALAPAADRPGWHALATVESWAEERTDDGLLISGTATLSASGAVADRLIIDRVPGPDGQQRVIVIDAAGAGVIVTPEEPGIGQRAAGGATVAFDRVRVPASRVGPVAYDGVGLRWRAYDELLHLAVDVGVLEGFLAAARDFVLTRARPWHESGVEEASRDPHTIDVFGEAVARVRALRLLFDRAADADPLRVTTARWYAHLHGGPLVNAVIGVLGASGTAERYGLDRYWRDLRAHAWRNPPHWTLSEVRP
ncbi:hypothetical protein [Luedemannella helvata]|uniref:Acyl-CoA dehydrogenase family protein n=1 Tax=Luedemannella helvata TaxID=349315 RepID=A0ABP4WT01_9ACTN